MRIKRGNGLGTGKRQRTFASSGNLLVVLSSIAYFPFVGTAAAAVMPACCAGTE